MMPFLITPIYSVLLLSVNKAPTDDVLQSLYKLRFRESDQLKTVSETHEIEIHQKMSKPEYQRLEIMVKRTLEQKIKSGNFQARNERNGIGAVFKNRREKRGGERGRGECYQWRASGTVFQKETAAASATMEVRVRKSTPKSLPCSEPHKDGKESSRKKNLRSRSPFGKSPREPCLDHLQGWCTRPSCDPWHPPECQNYKKPSGCRFGEKCAFKHQQVEGQPDKTPRKNGDNSAVVLLKNSRLLGCVFQDTEPPKSSSILQKGTQILKPTRKVKFSPNALRHIKIREKKGRSLGVIQRIIPHERSPYTPKFEDMLQEETELLCATHQMHDNLVASFRIWSRRGCHQFTEEVRHAETNPTCKIHKGYCASHKNSRPKSFARIHLLT